jgi:hypothetical protein
MMLLLLGVRRDGGRAGASRSSALEPVRPLALAGDSVPGLGWLAARGTVRQEAGLEQPTGQPAAWKGGQSAADAAEEETTCHPEALLVCLDARGGRRMLVNARSARQGAASLDRLCTGLRSEHALASFEAWYLLQIRSRSEGNLVPAKAARESFEMHHSRCLGPRHRRCCCCCATEELLLRPAPADEPDRSTSHRWKIARLRFDRPSSSTDGWLSDCSRRRAVGGHPAIVQLMPETASARLVSRRPSPSLRRRSLAQTADSLFPDDHLRPSHSPLISTPA